MDSADAVQEHAPAAPLLGTKFYAPRWRAGLVSRARLVERLDRGTASRLTLVSAPAGFGKTTLLAEWLASAAAGDRAVAWLSLGEADNQPGIFWTYVIAALQTVQPGLGAGAMALLQSPRPPPAETLLTALLNEAGSMPDDLVLVLDDYHVIEAPAIHEGIAFFIEHLPRQLHLVLASRADPPLPLARLRARGELTEVRAADLRFTPDEAAAFLNEAMGLALSSQDVMALDARTEGWIAALQLAALSMQGRDDVAAFIASFSGDDRYVVDYLVEEVLERQPDDVRGFLLQTSILERLSGPLCDVVTGGQRGNATLERLERGNLFVVPLDDRRQWYRYHHLFADVLQAHLREEQHDELPALHGRASAWFEHHALPSDAIRHALAADDPVRAVGLVELEAQQIVRAHQPDRLIEWLNPIPDNLIRSMPVLSTYYALALQGMGQVDAAEARLRDAERWLADPADTPASLTATSGEMVVVDEAGFRSLPSRVALARGYQCMASRDVAGTAEHARRGLELLTEDEHHWRGAGAALLALAHWASGDLESAHKFHDDGVASLEQAGDIVLALGAAYHGGDLLKARGRLSEAERMYERSLQLAARHGAPAMHGAASLHFGLSELYCERDDLESAALQLQQGDDVGTSAALPATALRRCLAAARLRRSQGDLDEAFDLLDQAERMHLRSAVPDVRPIAALKVRVQLAQGRLAEAFDWTRAEGLSVNDPPDYSREFQHITLARMLIAHANGERDGRSLEEVGRLLDRLLQAAEAGGRAGAVIEISMLRALVQRALGDMAAALVHLERALALAEPEGYVRLFVDEGEPMRDLLREAVTAGIGGAYSARLFAAFERHSEVGPTSARGAVPGLAEPLTAREAEILRLIAAGMRNQQIADQLVVSVATVKRHIANTYGKLGVGHRTEAVARANELALL